METENQQLRMAACLLFIYLYLFIYLFIYYCYLNHCSCWYLEWFWGYIVWTV